MKITEIRLKVYLLKDIKVDEAQSRILKLIDNTLGKNEKTLEFHNKNTFKNYCFNLFYPLEMDGVYKKGNIYTVSIRTTDDLLVNYLKSRLSFAYTPCIKALDLEIRIIPYKKISNIYSITPTILKTDLGYWKNHFSLEFFEERIKNNLLKKYNNLSSNKLDENFVFYKNIQFKNKIPIGVFYKNIKLLGDKINLDICEDTLSQNLAYMILGTGLGEANSRGFGFMGYRWK